MKAIYFNAAGAVALTSGLAFTLAACVPSSEPPAPTPPPVSRPAPTPAPAPPAPPPVVQERQYANYLDAPQTPGTWTYVDEAVESLAIYGTGPGSPSFVIRCSAGYVYLARYANSPPAQSRAMSVKTETVTRQLQADPVGVRQLVAARLTPSDPLLDAMAITKGRIAIGVEGERTLYLPAWVEISRVIEDCR